MGFFVNSGSVKMWKSIGPVKVRVNFAFGSEPGTLDRIGLEFDGNFILSLNVFTNENVAETSRTNRVLHAIPSRENRAHDSVVYDKGDLPVQKSTF